MLHSLAKHSFLSKKREPGRLIATLMLVGAVVLSIWMLSQLLFPYKALEHTLLTSRQINTEAQQISITLQHVQEGQTGLLLPLIEGMKQKISGFLQEETLLVSEKNGWDLLRNASSVRAAADQLYQTANSLDSVLRQPQENIEASYLFSGSAQLVKQAEQLQYASQEQYRLTQRRKLFIDTVCWILTALCFAVSGFFAVRLVSKPMAKLASHASVLAGQPTDPHPLAIAGVLKKAKEKIDTAAEFVKEVGQGQYDLDIPASLKGSPFGKNLDEMREQLQQVATQEEARAWESEGLSHIAMILSSHRSQDLDELTHVLLSAVVKHTGMQIGAFYTVEDKGEVLRLASLYAYDRKRFAQRTQNAKAGLLGQCLAEKSSLYVEEVPEGYIQISSALGHSDPMSLLLVPVVYEQEVFGVIELGANRKIQPATIRFVEVAMQRIGASFSVLKTNMHTRQLLSEAQKNNEQLVRNEELLKEKAVELEHTQSMLNEKFEELERETNLTRNIIQAINKTSATVQFDMKGNILETNDMFVSIMGYLKEELIGTNEKAILPKDEQDGQRYELLWNSLRDGSFISGEYRRINKEGKEVWINGTYNPIFDLKGVPYKVILIAQFTTEEKERDLDYTGKLNAMSSNMPIIDLSPEGKVMSANQNFLSMVGKKRTELRNLFLKDLLCPDSLDADEYEKILKSIRAGDHTFHQLVFRGTDNPCQYTCLTHFNPIRNLAGEVVKSYTFLVDLTDRVALEKKVKNTAETYRGILEASLDAVIISDQDGVIQFFNEAAEKLWGYSRQEMAGQHINILMPPDMAEQHPSFMEHYVATGEDHLPPVGREIEIMDREEKLIPALITLSKVKLGTKYIFTAFLKNITRQKQLISQLEETLSELSSNALMLDQAAMIFEMDPEGSIFRANEKLSQMLGKDPVGSPLSSFLKEPQACTLPSQPGELFRGRLEFSPSPDADFMFWGDTTIVPVVNEKTNFIRKYIAILFDVSENVSFENTLQRKLAQEKARNTIFRSMNSERKQVIESILLAVMGDGSGQQPEIGQILANPLFPTLLLDREGKVIEANEEAERTLGPQNIRKSRKHGFQQLLKESAERIDSISETMRSGSLAEIEAVVALPDDSAEKYFLVSMPVYTEQTADFRILLFLA